MDTLKRQLEYKGKKRPKPGEKDAITGENIYPYIPSDDLKDAVNLAIYLQRPLLLEGEPGGGKTELGRAVAYDLGLTCRYTCIKSTSKARDLLYNFDTIGRLRDAQLAATNQLTYKEVRKVRQVETYREFGVLGEAFQSEKPMVVILDEIDKANTDFPNDLLQELDKGRFYIKETKEWIPSEEGKGTFPLIFITSNGEKRLPDAFLRRCLYYYVEFPEEQRLKEIINQRFSNLQKRVSPEILETGLNLFLKLRSAMEADEERELTKKVSTSEWIQWIEVIQVQPQKFNQQLEQGKLPFAEVLLKSDYDRKTFLMLPKQMKPIDAESDLEEDNLEDWEELELD